MELQALHPDYKMSGWVWRLIFYDLFQVSKFYHLFQKNIRKDESFYIFIHFCTQEDGITYWRKLKRNIFFYEEIIWDMIFELYYLSIKVL